MSELAIQVNHISKRYRIGVRRAMTLREQLGASLQQLMNRPLPRSQDTNTILALNDVSFELKQGEVLGIVGANGSGKSTLLKILSKITRPTSGWLGVNGRIGSLLGIGTGFSPDMTGRDNIYLNGAVLGLKRAEIDRKFDEIVEFSEIERFLDTPVKHYSSGMYVRLAFSVAVHLSSEILLLDEVLAVGDTAFSQKSVARMRHIVKGEGRTIIFVSHDSNVISSLCTRCIYLNQGVLKTEGDPATVLAQYAADFGGGSSKPAKDKEQSEEERVKITQIRFLRASSLEPLGATESGQDIVIEVEYESHDDSPDKLENVTIALAFFNNWGNFVTSFNSQLSANHFSDLPPSGKTYCYVPRLPLMPGTYRVAATMLVQDKTVFQTPNFTTLYVDPGDYFSTGRKHTGEYLPQGVYIGQQWAAEPPRTSAIVS